MSDTVNYQQTIDAFSKIVIEKWRQRMITAGVGVHPTYTSSRKGYNSFSFRSGNKRIDFSFLQYLHYVDRGVGREVYKGNSGDLGFRPKRQLKKWYYAVFMSQARALERIMNKKFGMQAQVFVSEFWEAARSNTGRTYDSSGMSTKPNALFEARKMELELARQLFG